MGTVFLCFMGIGVEQGLLLGEINLFGAVHKHVRTHTIITFCELLPVILGLALRHGNRHSFKKYILFIFPPGTKTWQLLYLAIPN